MKKVFSLFIIAVLMLCMACGCDSATKTKEDEQAVETQACAPALDAIKQGDFEKAYDLLLELDDNEQAEALLENFAFVPKIQSEYGTTTEYTYDDNGCLTALTTDDGIAATIESDKNGNILSATGSMDGEEQKIVFTYDERGNVLTKAYLTDGEVGTMFTYTYDENNRTLTETTEWYDNFSKRTYTYDDNGNLLTEEHESEYDGEGSWDKFTYTYDENGNKLTEDAFCSDGDWWKSAYTYDKHNNVLTETRQDVDGETIVSSTYTYDDNSNILTEEHTVDNGWTKYTYTYDDNNNMLTEDQFDSDGYWKKTVCTYDKYDNKLTEESTSSEGSYVFSFETEWVLYYYENGVPKSFEQFFPTI